jgi:hypothetical protein
MSFGEDMAVMGVKGVDQRCAGIGSADRRYSAAIEDHASAASGSRTELPCGDLGHDAGKFGTAAAGCDADQIEQAATGLRNDRCRQMIEVQLVSEVGGVHANTRQLAHAMKRFSFR